MRISDWSSDVCSSDLAGRRWRWPGRNGVVRWNGSRAATSTARTRWMARNKMHRSRRRATSNLLFGGAFTRRRSEEHTSELQSLMRTSYAVICFQKYKNINNHDTNLANILPDSFISHTYLT